MSHDITVNSKSVGDSSRYLPTGILEAGLKALPQLPKDAGHVTLIVRRVANGLRELPERVRLSISEGIPGDSWGRSKSPHPDMQLAVMQQDVATLIANSQPFTLFGDNLFVEFDLSMSNLPTGSRLRVGDAVVEVTPMPHNGCSKFKARFGGDGLAFVNAKPTRHLNLRGIYWKTVEEGDVWVGCPIRVVSRPK
jgi:MOSC domain-containing protein YiiM